MSITLPTNLPSGDRQPVLVLLPPARPTTVPAVLLGAARIIQANGLWQGDYVPDPLNREISAEEIPHSQRPMSLRAAINCATTGDPHRTSQLGDMAMGYLALSIDGGPYWGDYRSLETHVEAWNDEPGRTADETVALLERLATSSERAA